MTRALASRGIDELLTTGRAEVADRLRTCDPVAGRRGGLGISIVAVRLGRVAPPSAVAPAFADAARARSDRRQAITRAEEYRDRSRSEARGQAREIADAAAGRFDRLVQPARGEAERFTRVLAEARKPRRVPAPAPPRDPGRAPAAVPSHGHRPAGQDLDISLFGDEAPSGPAFSRRSGRDASRPATRANSWKAP